MIHIPFIIPHKPLSLPEEDEIQIKNDPHFLEVIERLGVGGIQDLMNDPEENLMYQIKQLIVIN